ncbi:hypothetical protein [Streptococcus suis]|uniref:hypothetical protein n=1 Tax=Streptococcus suis TaxID=1307 RepID=UPI000CF37759|nr:hypothetical protein [Streptococcus suis]
MPLRVKLNDRFQKRLSEWARKRKPFKNKQELDFLFGPGLFDDAFVLNACLKLIKTDVDAFRSWQAR